MKKYRWRRGCARSCVTVGSRSHISTRDTFRRRRTSSRHCLQRKTCRFHRACRSVAPAPSVPLTYVPGPQSLSVVQTRSLVAVAAVLSYCDASHAARLTASTAWGVCSGRIINPRRARRADPVTCGRRRSTQIGTGRTCVTDGRTARRIRRG